MRRLSLCVLAAPLTLLSGCAMSSAPRGSSAAPSSYQTRSTPVITSTTTTPVSGGISPFYQTQPATPSNQREPTAAPPPPQALVEDAPPQVPAATTTVQTVGEETTVSVPDGVGTGERMRMQEARIGAQVQRIRDEQIRIATNPGVCRDVCFAAGSICLAAQEVCHLAGDADGRCARARAACTEAGQQRDGTCPVCPPTH